ncbi:MAG: Rieske (2Fe-2S) protein [Flavobacteriales bacterium]
MGFKLFREKMAWYKVAARIEELEEKTPLYGKHCTVVNRKSICITRYPDKWYAFENKCPHQGVKLNGATCTEDRMIVCPWHRYAFSLETGRGAGLYMEIYPIKIEEKGVYVGFEYLSFLF